MTILANAITAAIHPADPTQAAERALLALGVRACAVDLETTGPEPTIDRIISIGLIHVTPGGGDVPDLSWRWSTLVYPEMGRRLPGHGRFGPGSSRSAGKVASCMATSIWRH